MSDKLFTVKTPGSTANLGPGFDSIGLALDIFLTIDVFTSEKWECVYLSDTNENLPTNEENLIVRVIIDVANKFGKSITPFKLVISNEIPLARGLGSSASAIVAGIEIANEVLKLDLSSEDKLLLACSWEGHIDNIGASVLGGLVVGYYSSDFYHYINNNIDELEVIAVIPKYALKTEVARSALPNELNYKDAIESSAMANLIVGAFMTKNWNLALKCINKDKFHEPFRSKLVPELSKAKEFLGSNPSIGCALSGAGPTVLIVGEKPEINNIYQDIRSLFEDCEVLKLNINNTGVEVFKNSIHV
ncbi:MAG: thrB [Bacillales bacterium]|jgi:homoserine kinase|nr:thrB [Bacillales bacterium]